MEKVESVQYQVALAIIGAWKCTSKLELYEELGWETLSNRRSSKRILQIHKIIDGKTPSYLKDKLRPNRYPFLTTVFRDIKFNKDRYKKSIFPDAISVGMKSLLPLNIFPLVIP